MQQNFAVIAADGSVTFNFQGVVHAQGLILDLATSSFLANTIQWIDPAVLTRQGAIISSLESPAGVAYLQEQATDPDSLGADFAFLRETGDSTLNSSKIELQLVGNNGNQNSGLKTLLKLANGNAGTPNYVSDFVLASPGASINQGGLFRCFRCTCGATAYTAADSNGRLYTPAIAAAYDPTLIFGANLIWTAPYDTFVLLQTSISNLTAAAGSNIAVATLLNSGGNMEPTDSDTLAKGAAPAISGISQFLAINVASGSDLRLFSYCSGGGNFNAQMQGTLLPNRGQIP
jgi:hypothetical protein